jgi:hypothetical protein
MSSWPVLEPSAITVSPGFGHERKVGEAVLESGLVGKKRHGKLSMIWLLLAANAPLLAELDFI